MMAELTVPYLSATAWAWETTLPPIHKLVLLALATDCDEHGIVETTMDALNRLTGMTFPMIGGAIIDLDRRHGMLITHRALEERGSAPILITLRVNQQLLWSEEVERGASGNAAAGN